MDPKGFFAELKDRRVVRAALVYVALAWVALQAADLLAGAGLITAVTVRWLILAGVLGFPLAMLGSWFVDSPWRDSKRIAVAGDIAIISGIGLAALLFAWQHWFASFTRPVLVVERFVATDTRDDSQLLADRIGGNLRTLLALRPELRVVEFGSTSASADFRIGGTLAQRGFAVRITVQLFESGNALAWSESFEGQSADEGMLLNRMHKGLVTNLPLPEGAGTHAEELLARCESLARRDALMNLARQKFDDKERMPPPRRPVAQQLAMQYLQDADAICPRWPDTELLRIQNSLQLASEKLDETELLRRYPNSAYIHREIAARRYRAGNEDEAQSLYAEACRLQPETESQNCT